TPPPPPPPLAGDRVLLALAAGDRVLLVLVPRAEVEPARSGVHRQLGFGTSSAASPSQSVAAALMVVDLHHATPPLQTRLPARRWPNPPRTSSIRAASPVAGPTLPARHRRHRRFAPLRQTPLRQGLLGAHNNR
ncbi:unnamed protein product, partial [Urochloa humidicola]